MLDIETRRSHDPLPREADPRQRWVALVTAPDLPDVASFGDDEADALLHTADAVATALQGRIKQRAVIPPPSLPKRGQRLVTLPALVAAKLALCQAMLETGTRKSDLARRLDVHPPQIDRLLDHDSRLDQIENAARAMGRDINIELVPAARPADGASNTKPVASLE